MLKGVQGFRNGVPMWKSINPSIFPSHTLSSAGSLPFWAPPLVNHCDPNSAPRTSLLRRPQPSRPQYKPPGSKNRPFVHILHLTLHKPIGVPRLHDPGQPESQVRVVQLRLRLDRHRHSARAEHAGASNLVEDRRLRSAVAAKDYERYEEDDGRREKV